MYICCLDHKLVKNNFKINEKTHVKYFCRLKNFSIEKENVYMLDCLDRCGDAREFKICLLNPCQAE